MSTPEKNETNTFSRLPMEIRLKIWEHIIIPSVHRVSSIPWTPNMVLRATRSLTQSAARARAALSVNRAERSLLLRWLLPNEIPILGYNNKSQGALRFHASRDIICFVWETRGRYRRRSISLSLKWWVGRFQESEDERPAWMSQVHNMAIELLPPDASWHENAPVPLVSALSGLGNHCSWFSGLKQLYLVCDSRNEQPRFVEKTNSDATIVSVRVSKRNFVRTKKEHVRAAFIHTGTYPSRDEECAYVSGTAAIEKLQMRSSTCVAVMEVWRLNKKRRQQEQQGLRDDGLSFDIKVGVLLHVRK